VVGEIHLGTFFFSDFQQSKLRPVLVLKEYEEDVLVLPLTTSLRRKGIIVKNEDLTEGKLKKTSIVITNKPFFVNKGILIRKIGKLNETKFITIKESLCKELGC